MPDAAFLFIHVFFSTGIFTANRQNLMTVTCTLLAHFAFSAVYFIDNFIAYGSSRLFRAFYIAFLGTALGAVYEIFEFVLDIKRTQICKDLKDTNMDA